MAATSTEAQAPAAAQCVGPGDPIEHREPSSLARSALAFAAVCHAGQVRESDGAAFIAHPLEVARLLRDAGCSEVVVAAGLLHDVVEDSHASVAGVRARFGADVAQLVRAVTDDATAGSYRGRKHMLREQVRRAGGDAALVFAADKISKVRELTAEVAVARASLSLVEERDERRRRLRFEHYRKSLEMLQGVAAEHPLVVQLARELADHPRTRDRATATRRARPATG